jgi:3-methyladenine DNA glycosylase AlkD
MNKYHLDLLNLIQKNSGKPTQHTFLDSYLGNDHPRYPINIPTLRTIAKDWSKTHRNLTPKEFQQLIDSLIHGESSTEKTMAGILLDLSTKEQRTFDPACFDEWLDHLIGWAEIDSVCTGAYANTEIARNWKSWRSLLIRFSKSKNINKRRASLVLFCSPMRKAADERLAQQALENIDRLKHQNEILITKAISWLLRSMIKHHRQEVAGYLKENKETLPKIAVRETMTVLKTGKKTK